MTCTSHRGYNVANLLSRGTQGLQEVRRLAIYVGSTCTPLGGDNAVSCAVANLEEDLVQAS